MVAGPLKFRFNARLRPWTHQNAFICCCESPQNSNSKSFSPHIVTYRTAAMSSVVISWRVGFMIKTSLALILQSPSGIWNINKINISWKFHENPFISFWVILLPDKQTNASCRITSSSLGGGNYRKHWHNFCRIHFPWCECALCLPFIPDYFTREIKDRVKLYVSRT